VTPRRGRRDNGLDASLWSPVRDVDPRIGEHLLDLLHAVGIAAYLEPSADVEPYTRTVSLPSPPSDRLFVDRARRAEARTVVDAHVPVGSEAPDHPRTRPGPRPPCAGPDEDAEWARIVAAFEAEHGRTAVADEPRADPRRRPHSRRSSTPRGALRAPAAPAGAGPSGVRSTRLLVVAGVLLVFRPGIRLSADVGSLLGVTAMAGRVALVVADAGAVFDDDGTTGPRLTTASGPREL
jgi:hypothetical protein